MAAFRRCILALAVLAIFAGLASAQAPTPMTCNLSSLNTTARAEGKNELASDLLLTCTGGTVLTPGAVAPTVNFTLTLPSTITSRTATGGASEALLLIDDPGVLGGPVPNFGTNANPTACPTANINTGCTTYDFNVVVSGVGYAVMSNSATSATTTAPNVYQGVVSGNSVSFFGVPVVPPGSTSTRTFRITNVRFNANQGSTGAVIGSLTVQGGNGAGGSGATLISLNQTQATLATVQAGLNTTGTKWGAGTTLNNCQANSFAYAGTVSFAENFASAFRTRQQPATGGSAAQNSAQNGSTPTQTVPGSYFSESGYEFSGVTVNGVTAGLADFGTRLKAVFNNIPTGTQVWVSFGNVNGANSSNAGAISPVYNTTNAGSNVTTSFAALINGAENVVDTTSAPLATVPAAPLGAPAGIPIVQLTVSSGTATAVWEVLNDNPSASETFTFAVYLVTPAQATTGQATVNLGFAPTATSTTIPSFADTSTAANAFNITQCKTVLLYPYITSANGFDTGIAVANTTSDIYGTAAQAGACTFTFYGTTPVPAAYTTASIPAGTVGQFTMSSVPGGTGFTGYAIASCAFQYAHGFAFVADWMSTIQSSAMGYLAPILSSSTTRDPSPETVKF